MSTDDVNRLRSRAKSINVDWNKVISSETEITSRSRTLNWVRGLPVETSFFHPGYIQFYQSAHEFISGSIYAGQWNAVDLSGFGTYIAPHRFGRIPVRNIILNWPNHFIQHGSITSRLPDSFPTVRTPAKIARYTLIIMTDLPQTASDLKTGKQGASQKDELNATRQTEEMTVPKARSRAVSLSPDWDKVVSTLDGTQKIRRRSRWDDFENAGELAHSGWVKVERTSHTFLTGSSYTGQWDEVGMSGCGSYVYPYDVSVLTNVAPRFKGHSTGALQLDHEGKILVKKPTKIFCNESSYQGKWNALGMAGFGLYTFPHDVEYEGSFRDGMFHGEGTLTYPMGQKIDGHWVKGKLVSFKYRFADDLEYDDPWKYCKMPDRRFNTSILEGLRPAGRSLLTNNDPPREIPEGCYDTGDGFYNPNTNCVWSAIKPNKILRVPTAAEAKWIIENCRKAWDEPTGYKPELFEHWVSGRRTDSVFQLPEEEPRTSKANTTDSDNMNVNTIVAPAYNVSIASSKSWSEALPYEVQNEISSKV